MITSHQCQPGSKQAPSVNNHKQYRDKKYETETHTLLLLKYGKRVFTSAENEKPEGYTDKINLSQQVFGLLY